MQDTSSPAAGMLSPAAAAAAAAADIVAVGTAADIALAVVVVAVEAPVRCRKISLARTYC